MGEQRTSWQAETGLTTFATFDELVAAGPEVLVVATPPDSHEEWCIRALESGFAVREIGYDDKACAWRCFFDSACSQPVYRRVDCFADRVGGCKRCAQ